MTRRLRSSIGVLLLLAAAFGLPEGPAGAQTPPACRPETAGILACMAGRMCVCGFERSGRMTGAPGGWRWDCGILRPACGGGPDTPATTGDGSAALGGPWSLDVTLPPPPPRPRPPPPKDPRG